MPAIITLGIASYPLKCLTVDTAVLLANAMVSSRLDYSLLYRVCKGNVAKLHKVQNGMEQAPI